MKIRQEQAADHAAVYALNKAAFNTDEEAELVEALRKSSAFVPKLSLVAEEHATITGHILFTKITVLPENGSDVSELSPSSRALALAPMAVAPDRQREGIGSRLVEAGLQIARDLGYGSVIVLGHPEYYPRFGFQAASQWQIRAPFQVPDEAFMALPLQPGALDKVHGVVRYDKAFGL